MLFYLLFSPPWSILFLYALDCWLNTYLKWFWLAYLCILSHCFSSNFQESCFCRHLHPSCQYTWLNAQSVFSFLRFLHQKQVLPIPRIYNIRVNFCVELVGPFNYEAYLKTCRNEREPIPSHPNSNQTDKKFLWKEFIHEKLHLTSFI